jgi:hypothetical protein
MATLEELMRRASKASRKAAKAKAAALWPMPEDPAVLADPISTMEFGEARTIEEIVQFVHDQRNAALWSYLRPDSEAGPLPWCAGMPMIFDPGHLIPGHAGSDWHTPHPGIDYFPAPSGGLQHHVDFVAGRFRAHGIAAATLSRPPCQWIKSDA